MKKLISSLLIVFILITTLPITPISQAISEQIVNSTKIAADPKVGVTTIDLTGLAMGSEASHTHIYEKKYDASAHWDQCWICNRVINRQAHNITRTDYTWGYQTCYPGNTYTIYCADGCGYSQVTKDPCNSNNKYENVELRYLHHANCTQCGVWMEQAGCTDSNGNRITCQNLGTCVVCGHKYTEVIHHVASDGKCEFCGQQFVELVSSSIQYAPNNSYAIMEWRLRGINGGELTGSMGWYCPTPADSKRPTIKKNGTNDYTYQYRITFSKDVQNEVFAQFDSDNAVKVNGKKVHFMGFGQTVYYDHTAPTAVSITTAGNGTVGNYSTKATITATVSENFSDVVEMRLLDTNQSTVLANWGTASRSGNNFTRVFDVVAEIRTPSTLYVQSRDRRGNVTTQPITVQYIDAKAPTLTGQTGNNATWVRTKQITYTATDKGVGQTQIAFNNQNDFQLANQSGDNYTRTYNFVGDVYGQVTAALYLKDGLGNIRTERITISNIDNTAPTITGISQAISSDKKSVNITVSANDINQTLGKSGSGISGYAVTTSNTAPSSFQSSNTLTVNKNGTYYIWVRDVAGNISGAQQIIVRNIEIDITGNITWNDDNNKYSSRVKTRLSLYRNINNGANELVQTQEIAAGQISYKFQAREMNDQGQVYNYIVQQDIVDGYETTYDQRNVINTLILPTYTSSVEYKLIDAFQDKFLKNTEVEITAQIQADVNNREKVGLNNTQAVLNIDSGVKIDKNSIEVKYIDGQTGKETEILDFMIRQNTITIDYGTTNSKVTKAGDKLIVKVNGVLNEIKDYNTTITLTGNLTDYRGKNTTINLGQVTKSEQNFTVEYQKPQANISLQKRDSITEENINDATFTLYEWDGTKYVEKEILTDPDNDGIYVSNYYEWNPVTQGKYKIVETGIPRYYNNLEFSMEYVINQLDTKNYTITPEYNNGNYKIAYRQRNPDDFDNQNGVVENEPYKLNVSINNIDSQTKQTIVSKAEYTIYEWNNQTNQYEEYISHTNNEKVEMQKQSDNTYLSSQWLYYTKYNEGKYKIVETQSAYGYYGDYDENNNKREYEINVLDIIKKRKYYDQVVDNEGTIQLFNNEESNTIQNKRVETELNIQIIDVETNTNIPQSSATLEGAVYEIYALEQINHADGTTTRYPDEQGVLYKKDELIKEIQTDAEGKIQVTDLECGKYYIKQKTPSKGYVQDTNIYGVDFTYKGQDIAKIVLNNTYKNKVIKQAFQVLKYQMTTPTEVAPLAGAGFTIYEIKELTIVKDGKIERNSDGTYTLKDEQALANEQLAKKANQNGTYNIEDLVEYYYKITYTEENMETLPQVENGYRPYNLENEKLVKQYETNSNGEEIQEIITSQQGYFASPELAYGEYIVIETTVPYNKVEIKPFVVKIENDSREKQSLRYVLDKNFQTKIKVYTKDMTTNKNILKQGSKFVIQNLETNELVTYKVWDPFSNVIEYGTYEKPFETNRQGYFITPMKLEAGRYKLIQVQSADDYVINGFEGYSENGETIKTPYAQVEFEISTNQMYYVDNELESNIIVQIQNNKPQVGSLKITVQGQYINNVTKNEEGNYTFNYQNKNLEGVQIGIYAKEDIKSCDNQGTIIHKKDELVQQATTNDQGIIYFDNLEIGKYYLKEISAIDGFALDEQAKDVEISYGTNDVTLEVGTEEWKNSAQQTPVTNEEMNIQQPKQNVSITIINKDAQTKEKIKGAKMGLYAKNDILSAFTNEVIVKKDELITTATINEQGETLIGENLPLGEYYIKEITPSPGYILNEETIQIDATYNKDQRETINITKEYESKQTNINIIKVDEDKKPIPGAIVQIKDEEGNVIKEWETKDTPENIVGLEINKKYTIVEVKPADGYITAKEETFIINEKGEVITTIEEENNTMYTRGQGTIVEIELQDAVTKEKIKDVEVSLILQETEEQVSAFTTKEENYIAEKLKIGKYTLKSTKVPYGYKEVETTIEVKDTDQTQKIVVSVERQIFDIEVQTWIQEINQNGQIKYANTKEENKTKKIDIKDKNINKDQIKITYKIRVKNIGKINGQVGKIEVTVPQGMQFVKEDNKSYWSVENGKIITTGLAGRELKEGSYADIEIVLRWKNGLENFGTKANKVEIKEITSDIGFEENNTQNNVAKSAEIIIGVSTGEMNLVWICWTLLILLIIMEIFITKKLKIKKFKIKDKTLKMSKDNKKNKKEK